MESKGNKAVPRILIVDDVEANRFILRDVITDMGYQPVLTENGIQALKMVQHIKPQLSLPEDERKSGHKRDSDYFYLRI